MEIINFKKENDNFVWVNPDVRVTEAEMKEYLMKNPRECINIGDGRGWFRLKNNQTKTINNSKGVVSDVNNIVRRKLKPSKLLPSFGLTWEQKVKLIKEKIKDEFNEIPKGVTFEKMNVKKGKCKSNPDGLRLLVHIKGLERQRLYDYVGRFKLNKIYKEIQSLKERN